jgi:hypothetical protein
LSKMVLTTVDRVEDDVLVLVTHTDPVCEIHLPRELFGDVREGDVVRVRVEKDKKGREKVEREIGEIRKGLKREEFNR